MRGCPSSPFTTWLAVSPECRTLAAAIVSQAWPNRIRCSEVGRRRPVDRLGSALSRESFETRTMRFTHRFIIAIAALVVLQGALCPAICAAFAIDQKATATSGSDLVPLASTPSMAGCHANRSDGNSHDPLGSGRGPTSDGDDNRGVGCGIVCGDEVPLTHAAQPSPPRWSVAPLLACEVDRASARFQRIAAAQPLARPPPRPLFLLKSSFLI